jgi:pilus assembly protein CpaE
MLAYLHEGKPTRHWRMWHDIHRLGLFLTASTVKITPRCMCWRPPKRHACHGGGARHMDAILQLAAAHYDFVLLDMGRVLDPLALRVLDRAQCIVPVLLPNVPAVRNAQKLLHMFRDLGYPESRLHPVLNRVDRRSEIGLSEVRKDPGPGAAMAQHSDAAQEVQAAINAGVPLAESSRNSAWSASWRPGPMRCPPRCMKTQRLSEPALPPGMRHPTAQGDRHVTTRFLATSAPRTPSRRCRSWPRRTRRMRRPQRPSCLQPPLYGHSAAYLALRGRIHAKLLERFDLAALESLPKQTLQQEIAAMTERLLEKTPRRQRSGTKLLIRDIQHEMLGFGPWSC